jgi:hypothetical protein
MGPNTSKSIIKLTPKFECYMAKLDVTCCGKLKNRHEGLGIVLEERMN